MSVSGADCKLMITLQDYFVIYDRLKTSGHSYKGHFQVQVRVEVTCILEKLRAQYSTCTLCLQMSIQENCLKA